MIEIRTDNSFKDFNNQTITKVKSIIITTDAGDIILAPCKDTSISLTTDHTFNLLGCPIKKEVTIKTQYDNMIIVA